MSAAEIIEELEKLPVADQERVLVYLQDVRSQRKPTEVRFAKDADFEKAADKVLREHAGLFKRLAK